MAGSTRRCRGRNKRGEPCAATPQADCDYCYFHDPERAVERSVSRSAGGKARHGRRIAEKAAGDQAPVGIGVGSPADVLPLLEREINALLTLEISVARARTVGYLAGVVLKAFEIVELTERVEALEEALKARSPSNGRSGQW